MALQLAASIYGQGRNDWNAFMGRSMAFPTQGIVLEQLKTPTVYSGVTCVTAIKLLPTAPSPIEQIYYTPIPIATLVTNSNS